MAGAREAHGLVAGLRARGRNVIASLPEPERGFEPFPVPTRVGAFLDGRTLEDWIRAENVTCVLDASHAFDADIANRVAMVCAKRNLRYLRILRRPWRATAQDVWTIYRTVRQASQGVPPGARVFSNTGRASLPDFAEFSGHRLFLRQTQEPGSAPPFRFVQYVVGQPPFSQRSEEILFRELRISRLICRNVGGAASISKLLAARRLGIRVAMVDRPNPPPGMSVVDNVTEALAWEANG